MFHLVLHVMSKSNNWIWTVFWSIATTVILNNSCWHKVSLLGDSAVSAVLKESLAGRQSFTTSLSPVWFPWWHGRSMVIIRTPQILRPHCPHFNLKRLNALSCKIVAHGSTCVSENKCCWKTTAAAGEAVRSAKDSGSVSRAVQQQQNTALQCWGKVEKPS